MPNKNSTTLPNNSAKPIGSTGTMITGGIISLEEYNRNLIGKNGLQKYDIMRRSDSTIRSALQVVKLPLFAAKWDIQAPVISEDDPEAKAKAKRADYKARFIKRELFHRNVDFVSLLKSITSGLEFGYDVEEKTLELTDFEGEVRIGIKKIDKRKQTTILKWEAGKDKPGITQQLVGQTVEIPMEKLIVFTHDKEGDNHEGISLLRYVYKDWDIKDKLTIVNAIAIEKMAVGVPVIEEKEGSATASVTEVDKAIESISNMRANQQSYIKMPTSLGVAMLDMKSQTTKEVIPTLNYHDRRISQSILAQFMDLGGSAGSGSQSLSKDLTSLFMKSEQAFAQMIISCLQEQLIKQLCDFNFSDMSEGYPQLTVGNISDDDIAGLAEAVSKLVTAGAVTPEATLEDHLREVMSLPKLPQEIKDNYPAKTPLDPENPKPTPAKPKDDVTDKDKEKLDKKDAAVKAARRARSQLIDVLVA